ncbi:MAG: ATP-binding cassette domain-containing protein [Saprospiraceae bacterium]
MSILRVQGLVKNFGAQTAVDHVSFSIDKGEIVGFLGPNGAGKSTTMKMIAGIIQPDEGQIMINEKPFDGNNLELKKSIAYLPEQNPLYTELYVQEALEFSAQLHEIKNAYARISEAIAVCGLLPEKNKKIQQLSKGYKQRVGLAQSILHQPDLYILDEATTGLDPNQILEIRELIKGLGKDHAVLISTHILQEVESICQRCIVIHKGQVMADDDMATLKSKVSGMPSVSVSFAGSIPFDSLKARWNNAISIDAHTFVISDRDPKLSQSVFQWAVQNHFIIDELKKNKQRMEDVFQELTSNKKQ